MPAADLSKCDPMDADYLFCVTKLGVTLPLINNTFVDVVMKQLGVNDDMFK